MINFTTFKATDAWKCHKKLVFDWITVAVSLAVYIGLEYTRPFHSMFSLSNVEIQHPQADKDTVPVWAVGVSLK